MQKHRETERRKDEHVEEVPQVEKRDMSDIDKLLDEINEVLDTEEQKEIERQRFKEKLRSINFHTHHYRDARPCSDFVRVPRWVGNLLGMKEYDGPPCVDC